MTEKKYLKVVKYWAWYDLFVTSILALPIIAALFLWILQSLDTSLNIIWDFQNFDNIHILFVNLMWMISVVWSILRIKHANILLWIYDSYMRLLIAIILATYMLFFHVSLLFISFFLVEIILGWTQLCYGNKLQKKTQ
jgi:hypothetical protein